MKNQERRIRAAEIGLAVLIVAVILLFQLVGTTTVIDDAGGVDESGYPVSDKKPEDFSAPGTKIGILTGADWSVALQKQYPDATFCTYNSFSDAYKALDAGLLDAAMTFWDFRAEMKASYPSLAFVTEPVLTMKYGFGTPKTQRGRALCDEFNAYFREFEKSGGYEALRAKWEDGGRTGDVMGRYSFTGEKGGLKVVTPGDWEPMTFYSGSDLTGEFIELVNGFCAASGYVPSYVVASHSAMVTGLASGGYDLMASTITDSKERRDKICITDQFLTDTVYFAVRGSLQQRAVPKASVFLSNVRQSIRRNLIDEDRYRMILRGLGTTLMLSLVAGVCGMLLGALICFLRTRKIVLPAAAASLYIRLFRGLPIVVLLLTLNFVVFNQTGLSPFWVSIVAFSLDFSAYSAEIFRSGIEAVPPGQARAAKALGFGPVRAFWKVVWPQALVRILPVFSGQFIAMVKMTSVAGYISVMDLTKASDIIRSRTFEAFFPLALAAALYFLLSAGLVALLRLVERKLNPMGKAVPKDIAAAVAAFDPEACRDAAFSPIVRPGADGEPIIKVEHLRKSFGDVTPVADVSCEVFRGDVIAIIGASGTGKSTFINLLNLLETPDAGSIVFEGRNVLEKGFDQNKLREKAGMVFQSFNLFEHLTVIENLMLAQTELKHRDRAEACQKSLLLLQRVGLADKALCFPAQLSGGQQQRAAIVRTLAMDPDVIFFDEPTSALDPTMIGEVLAVIRGLAKEGLTMLIVTHEMRFARDVSNRVFYMDEGIIYEEGTPEQVFEAPQRDRTRQFVQKLKVFEATLAPAGLDFPELAGRIEQFAFRHMIGRRVAAGMQTVAEELCLNAILPTLPKGSELRLSFEYDETRPDGVNMELRYEGADGNPLDGTDELSLRLIQNVCREFRYTRDQGQCRVQARVV